MKNQVDAMRTFSAESGIAHFLNSSLNKTAVAQVRSDVMEGKTKLLYFAPESLTKEDNVAFLRKIKISFYAIDEPTASRSGATTSVRSTAVSARSSTRSGRRR